MTNSLVLGGSGFIGSNLVEALIARGERPRVFNRPSFAISNLESVLDQIDFVYGDFLDDVTLRKAVQGVDTVFHLISTTFPSMTIESSVYDVLSNLLPTVRLVEICLASRVKKIIYASSGGTIYGEAQTIPIQEEQPLVPMSAYGQSKLMIESYLRFYARTTSLDINILRISNPYGCGQNPFGIQGLVAVAMGCALRGRVLNIYGQGCSIRDYIYIDDVIQALISAREKSGSSVVNISSATGYSVLEIVKAIEEVSGRPIRKEFIAARPGDVAVNVLSNELARKLYSWTPRVALKDGLARTWDWVTERLNHKPAIR